VLQQQQQQLELVRVLDHISDLTRRRSEVLLLLEHIPDLIRRLLEKRILVHIPEDLLFLLLLLHLWEKYKIRELACLEHSPGSELEDY
jgi:hypothetical protein